MYRSIAAVIILVLVAGAAIAADAGPQVLSPTNGDRIGPNVDVVGKTVGKQFVVIQTDVYIEGADRAPWATVPGHRHWTDEAGNFDLRISTPRVWYRGGEDAKITYKIRTFSIRPGGEQSETTTVTCYPDD